MENTRILLLRNKKQAKVYTNLDSLASVTKMISHHINMVII